MTFVELLFSFYAAGFWIFILLLSSPFIYLYLKDNDIKLPKIKIPKAKLAEFWELFKFATPFALPIAIIIAIILTVPRPIALDIDGTKYEIVFYLLGMFLPVLIVVVASGRFWRAGKLSGGDYIIVFEYCAAYLLIAVVNTTSSNFPHWVLFGKWGLLAIGVYLMVRDLPAKAPLEQEQPTEPIEPPHHKGEEFDRMAGELTTNNHQRAIVAQCFMYLYSDNVDFEKWEKAAKYLLSPVTEKLGNGIFHTMYIDAYPDAGKLLMRRMMLYKEQFPEVYDNLFSWSCRMQDDEDIVYAMSVFSGTPIRDLLLLRCPIDIPLQTRFEHCMIIGASGHGKSQLMQYLMTHEKGGFCVIDSQGDMIDKVKTRFDNVLVIDPRNDLDLNMFDVEAGDEETLNATVALYEYIFGALLGAGLTQRQGMLFGYVVRLLVSMKGNILTLVEVFAHGEKYKRQMDALGGMASTFFRDQFFHPKFAPTKQEILTRLYGVLENPTFLRTFSADKSSIDIYEEMNKGRIILINTSKQFFQAERSAIFGRFFIAMLTQAAIRRAKIPEHERTPYFIYIDEFAEYADEKVGELFNQARKYKVGLITAFQNLQQVSDTLRATMMSSTSIKFAGGVSAADARFLSGEMRCTADQILACKKIEHVSSDWALFIRNVGTRTVSVPFKTLEAMPEKYVPSKPVTYRKAQEDNEQVIHSQVADSDGDIWG